MSNTIANNGRTPVYSQNGIGMYINVIDPSKLPPDHPILQGNMPNCTIIGGGNNGPCCYPQGYYVNNYGQKKRVTVLTDELIQKYDQLLENQDKELREYAASEVIKRLQEDKTRFKDEGLNTLVNKMLIDPYDRKVRNRGINAISLELAQGNAQTRQILENMLNNPNFDDHEKGQIIIALSKIGNETMLTNAPMQNNQSVSVE